MTAQGQASMKVAVPVCSFRKGYAREFFETEEVPPPSTVYGFLLSLVGEDSRYRYLGTRIAYALLEKPELSKILRTVWRLKTRKYPQGIGENRRPDYQEVLTGLELVIFVEDGGLSERLLMAGKNPSVVQRYGGLCLGESHDLVNDVIWLPELEGKFAFWLTPDKQGDLPLPVWVDHVGSKDTVWQQFKLEQGVIPHLLSNDDKRWIKIHNQIE